MMKKICILIIALFIELNGHIPYAFSEDLLENIPALKRWTYSGMEMSIPIRVILYAEDEKTALAARNAVFQRFHDLNLRLSDYHAQSELRKFCDFTLPGDYQRVGDDLWRVLQESVSVAELSGGCFDPTVGQIVRLWRRARRTKKLPSEQSISEALKTVGYKNLKFNEKTQSLSITRSGVRLDLGGIAKGYALDEALKAAAVHGVKRMMIDAGGDVILGDPPPGKNSWIVAVMPHNADTSAPSFLAVANCAVATSGDLSQHVEIEGKRYSHIVDPSTGIGLTTRCAVSILAPSAVRADALASAVSVMGSDRGVAFIRSLPDTEALILQERESQPVLKVSTPGWNKHEIILSRVMTYNVRNCRGMDNPDSINTQRVGKIISERKPDWIALQELDRQTRRSANRDILNELAVHTGMYATYAQAIPFQGGEYGVGILSREKPITYHSVSLPGREEARVLLVAEFQDYIVFCTHLSLNSDDRLQSIKIMNHERQRYKKPVFLAGDLNTEPNSEEIKLLRETWTQVSLNECTYPAHKPNIQIDYIFMSKPGKRMAENVQVVEEKFASDHRPLYADVWLP